MKNSTASQGVRPGVLFAVVGAIVVTVSLAWGLRGKPAPAPIAVDAAATVSPTAANERAAAAHPARRVHAARAPLNAEPARRTAATRLSVPDSGPGTPSPAPAASVAGAAGPGTFDYEGQAAQIAGVVRTAIARGEAPVVATRSAISEDLTQTQAIAGSGYEASPGAYAGVPDAMTQPRSGVAAVPGAGPSNAQAPTGSAPEQAAPPLAGGATVPGSTGQAAADSAPPGTLVVNNAVEAYREGERLRRAFVEEMRVQRVITIVQARQSEGL
jgi:hypothetical protein